MNQVEISFAWPAPDNVSRFKFPEETAAMLKRAVDGVLRDAEVEAAEVSVTLLGDEGIKDLNRRYLGHEEVSSGMSISGWNRPSGRWRGLPPDPPR